MLRGGVLGLAYAPAIQGGVTSLLPGQAWFDLKHGNRLLLGFSCCHSFREVFDSFYLSVVTIFKGTISSTNDDSNSVQSPFWDIIQPPFCTDNGLALLALFRQLAPAG